METGGVNGFVHSDKTLHVCMENQIFKEDFVSISSGNANLKCKQQSFTYLQLLHCVDIPKANTIQQLQEMPVSKTIQSTFKGNQVGISFMHLHLAHPICHASFSFLLVLYFPILSNQRFVLQCEKKGNKMLTEQPPHLALQTSV